MTLPNPDPRGLIREAYRIEGIGAPECRAIFLDWALGAPDAATAELSVLLDLYGAEAPEHPMTAVLRAALEKPPVAKRRGGRRGRVSG